MKNLITDRRLWLTAGEDRVVEQGDPEAAFLLVGCAGREIPADVASRLQLKVIDSRIAYPGSPDFEEAAEAEEVEEEENAGQVLRFGEGAQEEELEEADDSDRNNEPAPEWAGRTGPEAYLKRYPTGPRAELAARVIAANAGADGAT